MKRLVTNDRVRVGAWVAQRIGRGTPWVEEAALGLENDAGELVAGVVLSDYRARASGSLHCAGVGKYWLNREFLFAVFDYVFNQLDLKVLLNTVAGSNADSIRFTRHIGFSEVHRVPRGWDGEVDMILFQLCRDECRWLSGERYAIR